MTADFPFVEASTGGLSDRVIEHTREVALPIRDAFGCWTSTEAITGWLVNHARVEPWPGGAFEMYFLSDAPEGSRGSETCRVLALDPPRLFSFTWNAPPHMKHTRQRHTWVVVTFDAIDDTHTRVTLRHLGWPATSWDDSPEWAETFAYFDAASGRVLDALVRYANGAA